MATQGLLSIVDTKTNNVLVKVIVGCNGYNMPHFADMLASKKDLTIADVYLAAKKARVGCKDCRVVMDKNGFVGVGEIDDRYRSTFNDQSFNPRWARGTAAYAMVLHV